MFADRAEAYENITHPHPIPPTITRAGTVHLLIGTRCGDRVFPSLMDDVLQFFSFVCFLAMLAQFPPWDDLFSASCKWNL